MDITILKAGLLTMLIAYLLGSINFAVIVSRLISKDDVRKHGSGNAGATNMLRTYGKLPAMITTAGDFSKGLLAVLVGRWLFSEIGNIPFDPGYLAGLFALIGHLFPIYFGFRGGKGVLTSLGIIAVVNPIVFCMLFICFIPVLIKTKIVSLVSVLGGIFFPIFTFIVCIVLNKPALYDTLFATAFCLLVLIKHHSNIKRLLNGTEPRLGQK
ncbi:MAG: glycerol-3-phosphate 1-O-acyltransferase PlsY [Oscillospiraceae bacterium]